jgi:excinuclease ABC subunit C
VRSYFHASAGHDRRIEQLVAHIADIEWIVVGSELEALILEMNLIKKHRPHYNVRLKDDKRYPYIKVHWADPFPTVTVTRQATADGSRYFGPYTSVWAVHQRSPARTNAPVCITISSCAPPRASVASIRPAIAR